MTKEEIIEIAQGCGLLGMRPHLDGIYVESLVAFAKLVAEAEREACAELCDEKVNAEYATGKVDHNEMGWTQACAIAIRARGQA